MKAFRALTRIDDWGVYHSPNICFATEGPLVRDGSQTTANADLSTSASLAGPNSSGQYLAMKIVAARKVNITNTGGEAMYGILQNAPKSGQAADVGIMGISKAIAGSACTAGDYLMTNSAGQLVPATSSANARVAQAIETAASGALFTVAIIPGVVARTVT